MFGQRTSDTTQNAAPTGAPMLPNADTSLQPVAAPPPSLASFSSANLDVPAPIAGPVTLPPSTIADTPVTPSLSTAADPAGSDDLVGMKQEALKHLQPLVGSLQQTPEEEFRTLMMMIQATDDRTMVKKALDAAKKIPDDKVRAQAMLDVINEINYFTQTSN